MDEKLSRFSTEWIKYSVASGYKKGRGKSIHPPDKTWLQTNNVDFMINIPYWNGKGTISAPFIVDVDTKWDFLIQIIENHDLTHIIPLSINLPSLKDYNGEFMPVILDKVDRFTKVS